jgi:hypothetical protein
LEVLVGLVIRLRAKRFKETFNGLLQNTWARVNFKRILNNKEQAVIILFMFNRDLFVEPRTLHKDWEKNRTV